MFKSQSYDEVYLSGKYTKVVVLRMPYSPIFALSLMVFSLFGLGGCERTEQAQMVETAPVLNAASARFANPFSVRRCMNLGNALEAPNEGEWGYSIREHDFQTLARAGFDTVRIPIRWSKHANHRPPYKIDPAFMTRVQTLVMQAQRAGLGVIIDIHHYEALTYHPAREQARFLGLWAQISTAFANAPANVYFEVLNEPKDKLHSAKLNTLYAKVLPIIRRTNPTRKVILGGYPWNSLESMEEVKWPKDKNLVATFHYYGPHKFTHQGAEWSDPVMPTGVHWGSKADMVELDASFTRAKRFATASGMPVFIGEFGVIDKVPVAERNHWVKIQRQAMEYYGFSWCAWDFSGAFKSYDTSKERWLPGMLDAYFGR